MHWLYALFRFFPYWALPLVLVFVETGIYFKRRKRTKPQYACWGFAILFLSVIGVWFAYRGDIHSDYWVRSLLSANE